MQKNKFNIKKILVPIAIFLISSIAFSQDIDFGDDVVDNTIIAPIDSNVNIVLILGIGYALFIIRYMKQRVENKVK